MSETELQIASLREQIAEKLRKDVLCGRLVEGERLSEAKLVSRFGVSRTPIREALLQLTQEGLLQSSTNAGVKVAFRPPDSVRELLVPIRRRVETFALRSYFSQLGDKDFVRWNAILDQMQKACLDRDYPAIAEHDIALHRAIVHRANQPDLDAVWSSLLVRVRSHFWETQRRNYANALEIHGEHDRMIKTFAAGDLETAVKALEENIG